MSKKVRTSKHFFAAVRNSAKIFRSILNNIFCISVASPQIVSSTLEDRDIFETQGTLFEIKCCALPRPDAKWFKDGVPLRISKRVAYSNTADLFQLQISKALQEDSGLYTVVFTNKLGEKSVEAFLNVEPVDELRRPKVKEKLGDVDADEGKTGLFTAVIIGDPIPEATW